ncbi:hypothetical protein J6590_001290 [Homalodisca vitripennis]|nr:hypothetical protein J6590_001290 [Homalodisca vitripennis]
MTNFLTCIDKLRRCGSVAPIARCSKTIIVSRSSVNLNIQVPYIFCNPSVRQRHVRMIAWVTTFSVITGSAPISRCSQTIIVSRSSVNLNIQVPYIFRNPSVKQQHVRMIAWVTTFSVITGSAPISRCSKTIIVSRSSVNLNIQVPYIFRNPSVKQQHVRMIAWVITFSVITGSAPISRCSQTIIVSRSSVNLNIQVPYIFRNPSVKQQHVRMIAWVTTFSVITGVAPIARCSQTIIVSRSSVNLNIQVPYIFRNPSVKQQHVRMIAWVITFSVITGFVPIARYSQTIIVSRSSVNMNIHVLSIFRNLSLCRRHVRKIA